MSQPPRDHYPQVHVSNTDREVGPSFKNDFGRYSEFSRLASGANTLLRSCFDNNLGRWVAVKSLAGTAAKDPIERKRLLREARVTAQLQHPNTVPVYELGLDWYGNVYFSMKRIEGENLFDIIQRIAKGDPTTIEEFNIDRLLGALIQASLAVAYAHTHGVVHRDLKPENLLIGAYGEVYVMDWGVALVEGAEAEAEAREAEIDDRYLRERLTMTGSRPGTPLYMSPEQIDNEGVGPASDVFSMGVVLYEALAAREPFRGRNLDETFEKIRTFDPPPPSEVASHWQVPPALDHICARAIAKKPEDRYDTMFAMIRDLRRLRARAFSSEFDGAATEPAREV